MLEKPVLHGGLTVDLLSHQDPHLCRYGLQLTSRSYLENQWLLDIAVGVIETHKIPDHDTVVEECKLASRRTPLQMHSISTKERSTDCKSDYTQQTVFTTATAENAPELQRVSKIDKFSASTHKTDSQVQLEQLAKLLARISDL